MRKIITMRLAIVSILIAAMTLGNIGVLPAAAKDKESGSIQVPVVGTTSTGGTFQGTATVTSFVSDGTNVLAVGTVSGLINGTQGLVSTFTAVVRPMAAPADAAAQAVPAVSCQILNLALGPLNLNVLGLVISIPNPIIVNIFAVPGAGNLLGNLLCAVANLLNGGTAGVLGQIADLLNQILAILGGL